MIVVCDIETNGLVNPDKLWVVSCRECGTGKVTSFVRPDLTPEPFLEYMKGVTQIVGHNFIRFDLVHLHRLVPGFKFPARKVYDTLVFSRMLAFKIPGGHSLEAYGERFKVPKPEIEQWEEFDPKMVQRCEEDTLINLKLFERLHPYILDPKYSDSFRRELDMEIICQRMQENGFYFNWEKHQSVYLEYETERLSLEKELQDAFPPQDKYIKTIIPFKTKHGTIALTNIKPLLARGYKLEDLEAGKEYPIYESIPFKASSLKQIIERMWEAGWKPVNKTAGYLKFLRSREDDPEKLKRYEVYGWKVDDTNLNTLPEDAPEAAHKLVRYLFVCSRLSTLEEWEKCYNEDTHRIHGHQALGTWTHRNNHTKPNMGNVAPDLRDMWTVPDGYKLLGTDAQGIQMRILAHYMDDPDFIREILEGDAHQFNADILETERRNAKTWYYAWVLGAGLHKQAEILQCKLKEAKEKEQAFLDRFPALKELKEVTIPAQAAHGYFIGLDGRIVKCDEYGMLAGMLQNGEKVIMSEALRTWCTQARKEKLDFKLVNWIHDEWQTEVLDRGNLPLYLADIQVKAICKTTETFNLRCPMDGSYKIGTTWAETH